MSGAENGARLAYRLKRKREKRQAARIADHLREMLSKDPDWQLATNSSGGRGEKTYHRRSRAITRITKKVVRLLYPVYTCNVSRGRGTAHGWVHVRLGIDFLRPDEECSAIIQKTEDVLIALGIRYSTYTSDFGPYSSDPQPCLSVRVDHMSL